jgi:D-inositol-3-phosphate glycosyltransferase
MSIKRLAILSVHTSPLAPMGGKKTGGMNVYIRELSQELGARGLHVDIFTRRTSEKEPDVDERIGENVRVIYLQAGPVMPLSSDEIYPHLSQFTAKLMAFCTMQNIGYEMIYSHYWLSGWVAQKLKEAWGTPFVQMFHTLGQMKKRIRTHGAILPDQRISTETQVMQEADRIVAATPAEHAQLLWLYRANRRKIDIVPPGVDVPHFQQITPANAREQMCFQDDTHMLLFVGRIEPLKAVDTILRALHTFREDDPALLEKLCFMVIGGHPDDTSDPEMQRLQRLTRELNLEDYVVFAGAKERDELPVYYAAASAVIMPSDYESFGMVALEAMASGTPVIASEVGGLAYLVKDNETGFLVPAREPRQLADRIKSLVTDDSTRQKMGEQAAHHARDYAWSAIADRLTAIFEDVLAQRRAHQTA